MRRIKTAITFLSTTLIIMTNAHADSMSETCLKAATLYHYAESGKLLQSEAYDKLTPPRARISATLIVPRTPDPIADLLKPEGSRSTTSPVTISNFLCKFDHELKINEICTRDGCLITDQLRAQEVIFLLNTQ